MAPSKFIQTLKTNSSAWINKNNFLNHKFNWQRGGGIFSVSHSHMPNIIDYIDNQKEHHKKYSFKSEYLKLLRHYGIEFKEEYLLDFINS